jgi:hypothetical protein
VIAKDCRKLSNWTEGANNEECYRDKAFECVNLIKAKMDELIFAKALRDEPVVALDDEDED